MYAMNPFPIFIELPLPDDDKLDTLIHQVEDPDEDTPDDVGPEEESEPLSTTAKTILEQTIVLSTNLKDEVKVVIYI
jgi:hypothetical protein